ncbi:hypothetical protein D6825_01005 [Candidatus Woesearchaeota archaeon]|nr:MAG: hypothetical protein D6825_01005 [Candidatus Woesearchaeota archaeon]
MSHFAVLAIVFAVATVGLVWYFSDSISGGLIVQRDACSSSSRCLSMGVPCAGLKMQLFENGEYVRCYGLEEQLSNPLPFCSSRKSGEVCNGVSFDWTDRVNCVCA